MRKDDNTPSAVQSMHRCREPAADIIKIAMIAVHKWIKGSGANTRMIMQVHDELVLEVPDAELDGVRSRIPELMAGVAKLDVPLVADVGTGPNWEQAH